MSTTNILITPAADCPAPGAEIPPMKAKPTRATIEYDLLTTQPYTLTHMDFSHAVHVAMAKVAGKPAQSFEDFHAKGQPCMRASALTKRYGWAAHYDGEGRLALVDPQSAAFGALSADPDLPRAQAMRSKRA
ncbi:MAG: DUF6157 family protein [Pseudomonadota bacterium]|nr:DUF6157 family protein [Pseudomonadota bacterium]